jgi:hypothetical protein
VAASFIQTAALRRTAAKPSPRLARAPDFAQRNGAIADAKTRRSNALIQESLEIIHARITLQKRTATECDRLEPI